MRKSRRKLIIKSIIKNFKLRYLIILIVLLSSNTLAWFIYSNAIEGSFNVHVKAWKVVFQTGDEIVASYVDVDIDNAYPGMEDYNYTLTAYNKSEVLAKVTYEILEATIFGEKIVTKEGKIQNKESLDGTEITSEELYEKLQSDYPFKVYFSVDEESIDALDGEATFSVNFVWAI